MAYNIDGVDYLTIAEAVEFMGCTDGWVRMLCREGKLESRMMGKRLRLVAKRSAAFRHSESRVPKLNIAIEEPSRKIRPLPISSGSPRCSNAANSLRPKPPKSNSNVTGFVTSRIVRTIPSTSGLSRRCTPTISAWRW